MLEGIPPCFLLLERGIHSTRVSPSFCRPRRRAARFGFPPRRYAAEHVLHILIGLPRTPMNDDGHGLRSQHCGQSFAPFVGKSPLPASLSRAGFIGQGRAQRSKNPGKFSSNSQTSASLGVAAIPPEIRSPRSHRSIVDIDTPSFAANTSLVIPMSRRQVLNRSANVSSLLMVADDSSPTQLSQEVSS